ncbi:MAG TPA: TetR/AcrR family transcriptional regulator [Actinocrinis sp.]
MHSETGIETTPALGRPRSEEAHRAILDAALRLTADEGYQAVTIKGIAEAAGVGRQTIYRWWPTKGAIVLEAVRSIARQAAEPEPTGDAVADLRALLRATFALNSSVAGPAISGLMAESTGDPRFAALLQEQLLAPRRAVVRGILERGQEAGQLGRATGLDLVVDTVWGTMWYRTLSKHRPVDAALADDVTEAVVRMLGPGDRPEDTVTMAA